MFKGAIKAAFLDLEWGDSTEWENVYGLLYFVRILHWVDNKRIKHLKYKCFCKFLVCWNNLLIYKLQLFIYDEKGIKIVVTFVRYTYQKYQGYFSILKYATYKMIKVLSFEHVQCAP